MIYREARTCDIKQLQLVRHSAKENVAHNPLKITEYDYLRYLTIDGKGWVCELGGKVVGFVMVDTSHHYLWALYVLPGFTGKGIGRRLLTTALDWYFTKSMVTLSAITSADAVAERFLMNAGWKLSGTNSQGDLVFEMEYLRWKTLSLAKNN